MLALNITKQSLRIKKMENKLTPKQETFCQEYIKCGNASQAYRKAYDCENMKPETINVKACELLKDGNITVRVKELDEQKKNDNIADAQEIQETLTKLLRGQEVEQVPMMSDTGLVMAEKIVTPKDRIKAGETLAKMRGYFDLKIKIENVPIINDDIV